MTVREFVVNNMITLKLEDGKTNLYVNGKLYIHCKYLILNIPVNEVEKFEDIKSIEEAAEKLKSTEEPGWELKYDISPEEEFFGHCSNLQAWAENGYDSRILHYSLSFSLLQELAEKDPQARLTLKEEIAKRLESESQSVVDYLHETELIYLLSYEMLLEGLVDPEDLEILKEAELEIGERFYYDRHLEIGYFGYEGIVEILSKYNNQSNELRIVPMNFFDLENKFISFLRFESEIQIIPKALCKLKHLKHIVFADFSRIKHIPRQLKNVEFFDIKNDKKINFKS
ncbi:hypothetical protein LCGC14_0886260 [marine sediment metagenome]|uniref:Leucine-rich repeat domain-containing protein n=1 Tax=marine sediment metagenome TaxID=412755 RepID=A0A0F9PL68_9ZZZZ|nr:hypothetical protein [bacterium]